jgi:glycosyltransferase involved in cell wall biosynthesis
MIPGKVSIIVPLYNQADFVSQCLHSAMNQDYPNFEVIVVDDGSTDYSFAVAEEVRDYFYKLGVANDYKLVKQGLLGETDRANRDLAFSKKLRIIQQKNAGVSEARNVGIRDSDGEFILPLDADDFIDSNYLSKTVPMMGDSQVGFVSTDMQYEGLLHHRIQPRGLTLDIEKKGNELPVCSLIRRAAFDTTEGYRTIFVEIGGNGIAPGYEDWDMWLSLMENGWKVAVVNEPLFHYRIKGASMVTKARQHHDGLTKLVHLLHPKLYGGSK